MNMATALDLSPEEWKRYSPSTSSRQGQAKPRIRRVEERDALMKSVRKAASLIKQRFGVKRIYLFGSLARGEWFTAGSDVDIAVEGIDHDDYWKAWQVCEEIIHDRVVDFVDLGMASDSLKFAIMKYGVEL
jgi:predicted nucleotidyltransferase